MIPFGNIGDVFKVIRVFAVVVRYFLAVCPYANRRTRSVAIGAKLVFPVFEFGLFEFNDDISGISAVFVKNDNICAFLLAPKGNGIFKGKAFFRVAVLLYEPCCV